MSFTLKQARMLAGKTQKQMAYELGIHRDTYLKIEKKPDLATIWQAKIISQITKVPYDDIFFAQ